MNSIKNKNEELKEIFAEFKENNMKSYDRLYEKYHTLVFGVVFTILKDREIAEDVVQDVFIKIYNMDKQNLPNKGELSWLYIVSKNEALGYLRKKKNEVNIDDIYEIGEESSEIQKIIDVDEYNAIISGLKEDEKEIVSLKILSNFTFKKIGQMLSMPTPTVQWKYYKAVDSLKISIGNLALFLCTFVVLMLKSIKTGRKNYIDMKGKNFVNNEDMASETEENAESLTDKSTNTNTNAVEQSKDFSNYGTNVGTSTTTNYNIDWETPVLLGFSGIFLIISIIFAIFFKNYQQKRKKKTSK